VGAVEGSLVIDAGFVTGFKLGEDKGKKLFLNSEGVTQYGVVGCEHCLYGLLLHTAPGSQQGVSSVHSSP